MAVVTTYEIQVRVRRHSGEPGTINREMEEVGTVSASIEKPDRLRLTTAFANLEAAATSMIGDDVVLNRPASRDGTGCTEEKPCLAPALRWIHSGACQRATAKTATANT